MLWWFNTIFKQHRQHSPGWNPPLAHCQKHTSGQGDIKQLMDVLLVGLIYPRDRIHFSLKYGREHSQKRQWIAEFCLSNRINIWPSQWWQLYPIMRLRSSRCLGSPCSSGDSSSSSSSLLSSSSSSSSSSFINRGSEPSAAFSLDKKRRRFFSLLPSDIPSHLNCKYLVNFQTGHIRSESRWGERGGWD